MECRISVGILRAGQSIKPPIKRKTRQEPKEITTRGKQPWSSLYWPRGASRFIAFQNPIDWMTKGLNHDFGRRTPHYRGSRKEIKGNRSADEHRRGGRGRQLDIACAHGWCMARQYRHLN